MRALTSQESGRDTVTVIITAGQSNTAGRCTNDSLPAYIQTLGGQYRFCQWSYTNGRTRLAEAEGVFRPFWPEMGADEPNLGRFAYDAIVYYLMEQALQRPFYVIKHAEGGTAIDPACRSANNRHWSADEAYLDIHGLSFFLTPQRQVYARKLVLLCHKHKEYEYEE